MRRQPGLPSAEERRPAEDGFPRGVARESRGQATFLGATVVPDRPSVHVRHARTGDVAAIRGLVDTYAQNGRLLSKANVVLYEDVQEFHVAESGGAIVGCGALHVMWEDLAEVRTLAVPRPQQGGGIGSAILGRLLETANELGVGRVFCLTFETRFFMRHGFEVVTGVPVEPAVARELLKSPDEGVAEFLDLERVRPNTLGNTRMLRQL